MGFPGGKEGLNVAHHFIISPQQIGAKEIVITGNDLEHLSRVLRLKPGETITVSDGEDRVYFCVLTQINKSRAVAEIKSVSPDYSEPSLEVTLLQGLPKGDKLELIIQKAVELGISRVVPVAMERSVVQLSGAKAEARVQRWQRIAQEAAKQSRRGCIPSVSPIVSLAEALEELPERNLVLLPWEEERSRGLKEILLSPQAQKAAGITLIIGPEGGLPEKELLMAKNKGAIPLSLGPRILRTETAAIATVAIVMYQLGDLGVLRIDG